MLTGVNPSHKKFSRHSQNKLNQKLKLVQNAPIRHGTQSRLIIMQIIGLVLKETGSYLSAILPANMFENEPPIIIAQPLTNPKASSLSKYEKYVSEKYTTIWFCQKRAHPAMKAHLEASFPNMFLNPLQKNANPPSFFYSLSYYVPAVEPFFGDKATVSIVSPRDLDSTSATFCSRVSI